MNYKTELDVFKIGVPLILRHGV